MDNCVQIGLNVVCMVLKLFSVCILDFELGIFEM